MVVSNWTRYECKSDDEASTFPFLGDSCTQMMVTLNPACSLTPLVMPADSGRQGAPKQQDAASDTQARTKKRKGADSADESAMKKARLESGAPMKKKPGRPRKQALQEEALPEGIPVPTAQVRSRVLLLVSHVLTSGPSAEPLGTFHRYSLVCCL